MPDLLVPLAPAFYDFDMAQIANNGAYIRWLEQGRGAWLGASPWPLERCQREGLAPVLTRTEIDYLSPLRLGDSIQLVLTGERPGASRWSLVGRFESPDGRTHYAQARQQGCFMDIRTGRPVRMPMDLREYLSR